MIVKLLVDGGSMAPGPALAQKIGPLGLNMGQIISQVNEATKEFKGTKVPVELDIDVATKEFKIIVKSPPVAELIKKELNLDKGAGDHRKVRVANIAIEQVIKIAKTKLPEMLENDLKAAVKTVVGTCVSLGILVENKQAAEVAQEIEEGTYDKEIKEGKTEVSQEKLTELKNYLEKNFTTKDVKEEPEAKAKKK